MCGIVGYIGAKQAAPILLDGLSKLEYRGYDSAGIAVLDGKGNIRIAKSKGRLQTLVEKVRGGIDLQGTLGIGHTRWATHGEPSERNAHPHASKDGAVVGVHNGIIENYQELKAFLRERGYSFESETDTEVAIQLIHYYLHEEKRGPLHAIAEAMAAIRGSYALALLFQEDPRRIYVARKDSPLVVGVGEGESFVASDVPAMLKHTRNVYYLNNLEIAVLEAGGTRFYNADEKEIFKTTTTITWDAEAAEKGGYPHFMAKEIHEQPRAVENTIRAYWKDGHIDFSSIGLTKEILSSFTGITFVACGSAWHVGMAASYVIEDLAALPVRVELASEYRYRRLLADPKSLVIIISQSGETADSLAALRLAKSRGIPTLAIVNVVGSSIAREADYVLYTRAGPEIAVATTKAYSAQLSATYLLAIEFALVRGEISAEEGKRLCLELLSLPSKIEEILQNEEPIRTLASNFVSAKDIFFLGRGLDYAIALEGSLKTKEISYIHSEAYAAGELKHGTISLIEDGTLVLGVLTQDALFEKTRSNMVECKARGAYLASIAPEGKEGIEGLVDHAIPIPSIDPHFMGSLAVVPLQLFGYYISVGKGLDVDKPRNLAKSVTVE